MFANPALQHLRQKLGQTRAHRLYEELVFALGQADRILLKAWGYRAALRMIVLAARRVRGLANLVKIVGRFGGRELAGVLSAVQRGELGLHFGNRALAAIDNTVDIGREGKRLLLALARSLIKNPKGTAPRLLAFVFGIDIGSGGLAGNGGIPDLDLLAGIGRHRSPVTHTVIAAILIEGFILAMLDLAGKLQDRLPPDHDPLWDRLAEIGRPVAESLSMGLCAGLAYHLFVDAMVQPAPYHDLPFSMPLEAHQTVFATFATAETIDVAKRGRRNWRRILKA